MKKHILLSVFSLILITSQLSCGQDVDMEVHPEYGGEIEINDTEDEPRGDSEQNLSEQEPIEYEKVIGKYFERLNKSTTSTISITTSTILTVTSTSSTTSTTSATTSTTITLCSGCVVDTRCIPSGIRMNNSYCSLNSVMDSQLDNGIQCQNNYQCKSNFCTNNVCRDIYLEIQEDKSLLQPILDWLRNLLDRLL